MRWHTLIGLLLLMGCGASPLREAALQNDLPSLRHAIDRAVLAGDLDGDAFEELAHATIERELQSARGDQAVARVRDIRACAGSAVDPLRSVAEEDGVGGAAATLALLEIGRADAEELLQRHSRSERSEWRAVAARAAIGQEASKFRQASMIHDDARVRRAAVHAAFAQPLMTDLGSLEDAASKDPDPLVRSRAIQTLGALGGVRVTQTLMDIWTTANPQTRQVIVRAWASPRTLQRGGEQRLLQVMTSGQNLPGLVAAERLLALGAPRAARAEAYLLESLKRAPEEEQQLAIRWAPASEALQEQLIVLTKNAPDATRVAAFKRLYPFSGWQQKALKGLANLSVSQDPQTVKTALLARSGLGDRSAVPPLKLMLKQAKATSKVNIAQALLNLEAYASAAPLLADDSAAVRTQVACAAVAAFE